MANLLINGGKKLHGTIDSNAAKNSTAAILCATPLIKGKTVIKNAPKIEEVNRVIEALSSLGLEISWGQDRELIIFNPRKINWQSLDKEAFLRIRSGLFLMGSLSPLFKKFSLPKSGGCQLGKRTVNPYIIGLEQLGISIQEKENSYEISSEKIKGAEFTMYESGDTATECLIMAAVLAHGETKIHLASANYMVQDLVGFLKKAGAKINWITNGTLVIEGVKELKAVKEYYIMPDPIESMAFISLAITTKSKLKISSCPIDFLRLEIEKLRVMGQKMDISKIYKSPNGLFDLVDIEIIPSKLTALPDKIHPLPYPGLNIHNLPLFVPILTQAEGSTLVHDWVYENRAIYYTEISRLGADIMLHDPHRVTVTGPTELKANEIVCPPALRPSINLLICMLAAKGQSILHNSYSIDRGYENIYERLKLLGADIKIIE